MPENKNSKIRKPGAVRKPGMGNQTNPFIDKTRIVDRTEEKRKIELENRTARYAAEEKNVDSGTGIRRITPKNGTLFTDSFDDVDEFDDTEIHRVHFGGQSGEPDAAETPRQTSTAGTNAPVTNGNNAKDTGLNNAIYVESTENAPKAEQKPAEKIKKEKRAKRNKSVLQQHKVTVDEYKFHKKMKRRRRRTVLVLLLVVLIIALTIAAGYTVYTFVVDHFNNEVTEDSIIIDIKTEQKFRVEKGESTKSLSQRLYDAGLIKDARIYRFLSKFYGYDGQYNAGTYTLSGGLSYEDIMFILSGTPETVKVTFPEGFTTEQIATRLERNNVCTAEEFLKAVDTADVSSYTFLNGADLSNRDHRLDGYLFPDTYEFDVMAKPEDVIYKMLNRFNEIFRPAYYEQLEKTGLTLDQVVILASIVEKEAKNDSDRAPIAGVFYNRYMYGDEDLKVFQSDATVRYAYHRAYGEDLDHALSEELELDDPYNTYVYPGFTPGPICSPGEASLIGALYPSNHSYYYFVAKVDGSGGNIYSRTYEEHLQAIKDIANYVPPDDPGYEDDDED